MSTLVPASGCTWGNFKPVPTGSTALSEGGYISGLVERNSSTIEHCWSQLVLTGAVGNFVDSGSGKSRRPDCLPHSDSDVYKVLEAMRRTDLKKWAPQLNGMLDILEGLDVSIASTHMRLLGRREWSYSSSWSEHELYCVGHLLNAATAIDDGAYSERLIAVASQYSRLIERMVLADGPTVVPGHPGIESALVDLYRATQRADPLGAAFKLLGNRGQRTLRMGSFSDDYCQDEAAPWQLSKVRGHEVRQLYLLIGMLDVYLETGAEELLSSARVQFADLVSRKMFVHGGVGVERPGGGHSLDVIRDCVSELPRAETCAGIGTIAVAWRLFLATGEALYLDVLEWVLFNNVLAGVGATGDRFFYCNRLRRRPNLGQYELTQGGARQAWYESPCCPTNLARFMPSIAGMAIAIGSGVVYASVLSSYRSRLDVGGSAIDLSVTSQYPFSGRVRVHIESASANNRICLRIRVPAWCALVSWEVGAVKRDTVAVRHGVGCIDFCGSWSSGDVVDIVLSLERRWISSRSRDGSEFYAFASGPLLYCREEVAEKGGYETVEFERFLMSTGCDRRDGSVLIPYHQWANRGSCTMEVWLDRASARGSNVRLARIAGLVGAD